VTLGEREKIDWIMHHHHGRGVRRLTSPARRPFFRGSCRQLKLTIRCFTVQIAIMNELVTAMNEPFQSEVQGPGVLIIRMVSLLTTMKGRIQTLEKDAQRSRQSHSEVRGAESANLPAAQTQDASIAQKENSSSKEAQMRQNVIPVFKLQIQSLTSKIQCHELEIKQLILEKEQLARDLINLKHQVRFQPIQIIISPCNLCLFRCWI
jgi:hypothetical protein